MKRKHLKLGSVEPPGRQEGAKKSEEPVKIIKPLTLISASASRGIKVVELSGPPVAKLDCSRCNVNNVD